MKSKRIEWKTYDYVEESFTLIELVLVLALISIVIGVTFPQFSKSYGYRTVQNEAEKIGSFIRYVQTKSRVDRKDYKVVLGEDNYWYVFKKDGKEISSKKYKIRSGLELKNKGDKEIWFYPDRTSSGNLFIKIESSKKDYTFIVKKEEGISQVSIKELKPDYE